MFYLGNSGSDEVFVETLNTLEKIFSDNSENNNKNKSDKSEKEMFDSLEEYKNSQIKFLEKYGFGYDKYDKLERLFSLKERGIVTNEEFIEEKKKILST